MKLTRENAIKRIKILAILLSVFGALIFATGIFLLATILSQGGGVEIFLFPLLIILLGIVCLAVSYETRKEITPKTIESLFALISFFVFLALTKLFEIIEKNMNFISNDIQGVELGLSALPFFIAYLFYKISNTRYSKHITN
jgi:hypothetical protein